MQYLIPKDLNQLAIPQEPGLHLFSGNPSSGLSTMIANLAQKTVNSGERVLALAHGKDMNCYKHLARPNGGLRKLRFSEAAENYYQKAIDDLTKKIDQEGHPPIAAIIFDLNGADKKTQSKVIEKLADLAHDLLISIVIVTHCLPHTNKPQGYNISDSVSVLTYAGERTLTIYKGEDHIKTSRS